MFSGGHTPGYYNKCLPCCCLSAMPFPDVLLLDHVSINVNVFWFVKRVKKGIPLQQNQNLSDVFILLNLFNGENKFLQT